MKMLAILALTCALFPLAACTNTTDNGLKCYVCQGTVCNNTVNCQGDQNHCYTAFGTFNGQTQIQKGCASDIFCKAFTTNPPNIMGLVISSNMTCCSGNLCNNAKRTRQSVFLLLVPLAFIKLFN